MSDKEIDENSLEYAKKFKKYLQFDLGETVFIKSDKKKKVPMTITKILFLDDSDDYVVTWLSSQKTIERDFLSDKTLMS